MRSFNKLANLHRVFFKRAGPAEAGLGQSPQDDKRRTMGMLGAYEAGANFLGGMMNPKNGGNPILAAANKNVLVPGAMAVGAAAPDVSKIMRYATRKMFKAPQANPDTFNDVNNAPPRKY